MSEECHMKIKSAWEMFWCVCDLMEHFFPSGKIQGQESKLLFSP